jgi:hypothetical protein
MALDSSDVGKIIGYIVLNLILMNPWTSPFLSMISYGFEINEKRKRFRVVIFCVTNFVFLLSLILWMVNLKRSSINGSFSATICFLFSIMINIMITEPIRVAIVYFISLVRYQEKKDV